MRDLPKLLVSILLLYDIIDLTERLGETLFILFPTPLYVGRTYFV